SDERKSANVRCAALSPGGDANSSERTLLGRTAMGMVLIRDRSASWYSGLRCSSLIARLRCVVGSARIVATVAFTRVVGFVCIGAASRATTTAFATTSTSAPARRALLGGHFTLL